MTDPVFHRLAATPTLAALVALTGAEARAGADLDRVIESAAPLDSAGPGAIAFLDNAKYAGGLADTRAGACFVTRRFAEALPPHTVALVTPEPYRAFAKVLGLLFPTATAPASNFESNGVSPSAFVHPDAKLETGVIVDPGAVIGPRAQIGGGTIVGAHAVIGADVCIGRGCSIGPHASLTNALLGNRVIIHAGVRIGQDGFGYAMGAGGHFKVPQIGRVIVQDDVEIGANTTIDRGSIRDTVVGEGSKIDNLVQLGHNVVLGRHCVLVSQTGISGSTTLGDYVVTAGQVGLAGHLNIGSGVQIGAKSGLMHDIPAGERWLGIPAQPLREQMRLHAILRRMTKRPSGKGGAVAETPPDAG